MKKKNIIAWSIVVGVLLTIGIICTMVFTLSKIEFQLTANIEKTERSRLFTQGETTSSVESKILESAEFDKGGNLLFMKFDEQISNIEKSNPYVKVERIVRKFPNKITVFYSEREAVALIQVQNSTNAYFVIDTDLKILDCVATNDGGETFYNQSGDTYKLPIITYFSYCPSAELKAGDFLDNANLKNHLSTFVSGAFSAYGEEAALYEDIMGWSTNAEFTLSQNQDNRLVYTLIANSQANVVFEVYNINERMFEKIALSWKLFNEQYRETELTSTISLKVYVDNQTHKITIADTLTDQIVDTEN